MVLSRRDGSTSMSTSTESSLSIFDGASSSDVKKLFFYYENVFMCDVDEDEMALKLLSHLDGQAFVFFYETFASNGTLKPEAKVYKSVKKALCELRRPCASTWQTQMDQKIVSVKLSWRPSTPSKFRVSS